LHISFFWNRRLRIHSGGGGGGGGQILRHPRNSRFFPETQLAFATSPFGELGPNLVLYLGGSSCGRRLHGVV
jgi:hypothetical protein